jgi:hypothetical protein
MNNPLEAFKFALGESYQEQDKQLRLRPRWNSERRAERPYSGRVTCLSIPLEELSVSSQFKTNNHGLDAALLHRTLTNGSADDYIITQRVAKYPSFNGPYKSFFKNKYGIGEELYDNLSQVFSYNPPHSSVTRLTQTVLGCHLSNFYTQTISAKAQEHSKSHGYVPIYQLKNGTFTFAERYKVHTGTEKSI